MTNDELKLRRSKTNGWMDVTSKAATRTAPKRVIDESETQKFYEEISAIQTGIEILKIRNDAVSDDTWYTTDVY